MTTWIGEKVALWEFSKMINDDFLGNIQFVTFHSQCGHLPRNATHWCVQFSHSCVFFSWKCNLVVLMCHGFHVMVMCLCSSIKPSVQKCCHTDGKEGHSSFNCPQQKTKEKKGLCVNTCMIAMMHVTLWLKCCLIMTWDILKDWSHVMQKIHHIPKGTWKPEARRVKGDTCEQVKWILHCEHPQARINAQNICHEVFSSLVCSGGWWMQMNTMIPMPLFPVHPLIHHPWRSSHSPASTPELLPTGFGQVSSSKRRETFNVCNCPTKRTVTKEVLGSSWSWKRWKHRLTERNGWLAENARGMGRIVNPCQKVHGNQRKKTWSFQANEGDGEKWQQWDIFGMVGILRTGVEWVVEVKKVQRQKHSWWWRGRNHHLMNQFDYCWDTQNLCLSAKGPWGKTLVWRSLIWVEG